MKHPPAAIAVRGYPAGISLRALLGAVALALTVSPGAAMQTSRTCEFALSGWVLTQVELREARDAHRRCRENRRAACTAEEGRIRSLEQRQRLMRNYVEGYCRR